MARRGIGVAMLANEERSVDFAKQKLDKQYVKGIFNDSAFQV